MLFNCVKIDLYYLSLLKYKHIFCVPSLSTIKYNIRSITTLKCYIYQLHANNLMDFALSSYLIIT